MDSSFSGVGLTATDTVDNGWAWSLLLLVLALVGIFSQALQRVVLNRTIRETWYAETP